MSDDLPPIPPVDKWLRIGATRYAGQRLSKKRQGRTEFAKNMLNMETVTFSDEEREAAMAAFSPANMSRPTRE